MKQNIDDLGVCGIVVADWDITEEFKPKTITTDYSSWICYISRRPVPANTPITDTYYWKPLMRLQTELAFDYNEFKEEMTKKFDNLRLLVETFLQSAATGSAIANEFGNSIYVGVNQKLLTEAINKVWAKFEDITGEIIQGINMQVSPLYFISEDGHDIHVTANTVETNGIFEKIQFYIDGELIREDLNTEYVEFNHHLDIKDTYDYVVMCKAQILGIEYTREKTITRYNEFYIGAGTDYTNIMNLDYSKQLNGTMRHNYNINFAEGDQLIIVMDANLYEEFIRADLNGAEIELTKETVTVDGKEYVVLTSDNWNAGTYNIDING